jgi:hypothetical protein
MVYVAERVHFYEAILACLAIVVWHFYFVIFDPDVYPMEKAWLTGKVSADHLRHTRPSYFKRLTGGLPPSDGMGDGPDEMSLTPEPPAAPPATKPEDPLGS